MERGLARRRQSRGRNRQIAAPEQNERPTILILLGQILLFLTVSLATFVSFDRLSRVNFQQPPPPCPACPLIPAGQNFSWINYIPRFHGREESNNKAGTPLYPAWKIFNASDASAEWADPVLPTEEESIVCLLRIKRSYRALNALWHPDRASPPTKESIGGLRTLLALSDQQLTVVNQVLNQAYNDAIFGCMTAAQKSAWLNRLTDRSPAEWYALEAYDVASEKPVDGVDPSDPGFDLTVQEYVHVRHCMEREQVPWEVALRDLREKRRSLFWRCRMVVERMAEKLRLAEGARGRQDGFRSQAGPGLERSLRRQRVLEHMMERTGALGGCVDALRGHEKPWWETKGFNISMCEAVWPEEQQRRKESEILDESL
ncbi:uncharacterized protein IWZ02DRAFT_437738 [Phyllosticta citriasiana]|uniref:J domain-containing protein n=1 Tax=Phyllosticta citriasiana TaxID=595635 RepID=A0ABR1K876_9PEZI